MPSQIEKTSHIPTTVFTGFLGAGKTSIILSLLPQLPKDYRVVLLKNEFGDVEVDSQLAKQSSLAGVSEILNGCMCCILVGQMKTALLEIREKYRPDRIIIECSGSAFPATLAFQLRELERETEGDLHLDSIVTVIDAENFTGYEDTSPTAKMQASYTDVILINKWEHISERALDILIDHLNTLNDLTPKIRCEGRAGVDPSLIFGLDSKLFLEDTEHPHAIHHDEVETVTVFKGVRAPHTHGHTHDAQTNEEACNCSTTESTAGSEHIAISAADMIDKQTLEEALGRLSRETVWRVKGFVRIANSDVQILNWAFGRFDLLPHNGEGLKEGASLLLTVMGERGEVKRAVRKFAEKLGADVA
ncbi:CobW/HypB/UreG, nucleotide-binding domain-containing protein [Fomitopsis betulina]|nr:CobW/HypB/UreG, nucleotide-binding domain-containing protein [Fomitopsis betulina]